MSLPKASYLKVRAQSVDFLEISNPRAVLEFTLRKYTCVTEGDVIVLNHAGKRFCMDVLEVKPNGAASIVETDVEIDFAEPVGYQDSEYGRQERERKQSRDFGGEAGSGNGMKPATLQRARSDSVAEDANTPKFVPFAGAGKRIDGKLTATGSANATASVNTTTSVSVATTSTSSGGLKIGSSSTTATSSSTVAATSATSTAVPTPTGYQSKIGDKFSKKKVTTSAFTGTGNKLT